MHMNLHKGDVFWQYTTTGWMMYQYQITALAAGATILCYDGSPLVNLPGLIRLMDNEKVTHFGASPRWLAEVDSRSIQVKDLATLTNMRCVTSTGSLLMAEQFYSFYKSWPPHIQLASISGGTVSMFQSCETRLITERIFSAVSFTPTKLALYMLVNCNAVFWVWLAQCLTRLVTKSPRPGRPVSWFVLGRSPPNRYISCLTRTGRNTVRHTTSAFLVSGITQTTSSSKTTEAL